jgi:hypothetical protein
MRHHHRALWIAYADLGFLGRGSQRLCWDGGVNWHTVSEMGDWKKK